MENPTPTRGAPGGRRSIRGLVITLLVAAVVASALYTSVEYFGSSNSAVAGVCGTLSIQRRGLPCDIPLPAGVAFIESARGAYEQGVPMTSWTYSTSQPLTQIGNLYNQGLGAWWLCSNGGPYESWLRIEGGDNPNRPNTTLDVAIVRNGASGYKLTVSLIQSGLPFWSSCNGA